MGITDERNAIRNQASQMEDQLINEFIEKDLKLWDPKGSGSTVKYLSMHGDERQKVEVEAFKAFIERQKAEGATNGKIGNLSFENYLKIDRPEKDYKYALYNENKEGSQKDPFANIWVDVFGENTGIMKAAARNGMEIIKGINYKKRVDSELKG